MGEQDPENTLVHTGHTLIFFFFFYFLLKMRKRRIKKCYSYKLNMAEKIIDEFECITLCVCM